MVRSVIRRLGLTVLSLMVLLGSMISFPTVTVYAAVEGDYEYVPAFAEGVKITAYHGATGGHVDIPNQLGGLTVTEIGYESFKEKALTSVTIPNSVTYIHERAFYSNQLTSITLPTNISTVGIEAFKNNQLTSLTIPSSINIIAQAAFEGNKLKSLNLPAKNFNISIQAFRYNELTSLIIPEGMTYVGVEVFQGNKLTSLSLPNSLTHLARDSFKDNELTTLTIPASVTQINQSAFEGNNLSSLTILSNELVIKESAFRNNKLSELTIPEGVLSIGTDAFQYNELTSLSLPSSLTTIGNGVFKNNKLSELTIPEGVLSIGVDAFQNNKLTSLSLPSSLTTIGNVAFQNNELTELTLPNSVTTIGAGAFEANKLSSINFSINLHTIEDGVFKNNLLTSLVIPDYVTSIKNEAFASNRLESLTLPDNGLTIGMHAFNDNQLVSLTIPNSIYVINVGAFRYNKLTSVTLSESITSLSAEVFEYNELTSLQIPASVETIQANAFKNNKLTSLILPEDLVFIGEGAFEGNEISSLIFLNSDVFLANNAFRDNQLTSLTIPEGMERIRENVFQGNKLTSLTLPDSLTRIDSFTFSYNELQYLTIPKNMISVYPFAFSYNPSLSDVLILSPTVELRDEHIFYNSSPDLRLHGYAGSTAETYAATIGATFQPINAELEDIQLNIAGFTFDPVVRNFNVMTNAASVIVTPIARSPFSIVKVNDEPVIYGESASAIPLVAGVNSITIDVEAADGNSSEQYKIVLNVNQTAPTLNLSATPTTPTNGNVTINIEAVDAGSGIVALKWTTGNENVAFFATGGQNVVDDKFEVSANGTYTVYARDGAGNEVVKTITVSNIASDAPVISLTATPTTPTNGNVTIEIEMDGASSGLASFKWAVGNQDEAFFSTGGQNVVDDKIEVTANGTYTVYARDNAGNEVVETINVGNIDKTAPTLDLTPSTIALTYGNVTVAIEAEDADSGIAQLKWSSGNRDASFFAIGGQVVVDDEFVASVNGIYTVYARDVAGNEVVRTINISNIDKIAPTLALTASPTAPTNGNVSVEVEGNGTGSAITSLKWALGNQDAAYFATGGQNIVADEFEATANGIYTVYARDAAGNEAVATIEVNNIDRNEPTINLTATPTGPTNGDVTITVESDGTGSAIDIVKWVAGDEDAAFFASGGQEVIADEFAVTANGVYTVYARDAAGNEVVETISVSNVDRVIPTIELTPSPAAPTNGIVTIAVGADGTGSTIASVKWTAGNEDVAFFASAGQNVVDDEFEATANGIYTIYARDAAGNEAVATIEVNNIDRNEPTINLTATPTGPTNGNVTVAVEADGTGSALASVKWTAGNEDATYFATGGQDIVDDEFVVTVNGIYTLYARDAAGNEAVRTITVGNIDRNAPTINLTADPIEPTSGDVTVTVEAEDTDSGISELKWAAGDQGDAYFVTGGQDVVDDEFEVIANGVYTVNARDAAGNEAVSSITISNIVRSNPTPPSNEIAPRTSVTIDKDIIVIEVSPRDIREVPTDSGGTKAIVTLPNDVWNEIPKLLNEADRPVITIVITGDLPDVEVHLPSIRVNELMDINSNVQFDVQLNKSSFQLLVNILDLEQLAKQLGIPVDELNVIIKITELAGEAKQQFILAAEEQGLRLLSEVIQFQLLVSGGDKLVEITDFGGTYMTKSILLDSQLTTRNYLVVLYDPDRRTFSYVPAVLEGRSDDQQDAIIQMPHNSIYAIVDAERVQFADMNGHWARSVVEQLGSKRIVKGITSTDFGGNRNITRAEFASLLVRALGIKTDHNGSGEIFQDVSSTSWYALEVEAAFKAGLVKGVSATHFAPDQPITREQIALMLMNAWRLVNDTELTLEHNTEVFNMFTDAAEVSSWAREAIAEALSLKLMQGMSADRLAPTELATRAQAAVMLHRFLVLINFLA